MDVLLMILTSICCGALMTAVTRREGIGWWIGDQISALIGAGLGLYMVNTQNMHKLQDYHLFWVMAVSGATAMTMLVFSNWLLGGEEEENTEPSPAELSLMTFHDDNQLAEEPHEYPLRRAA